MTPYEIIGGSEAVRALVDHFYDLIERDPAYAPLRAIHAEDLGGVRAGLAGFMAGWLGGPRDWFGQGKCVMSLHGPIAIDPALADQWADAMRRAIDGQPGLEADFRDKMTEALRHIARSMINRAGQGAADAKVAASG